MTLQRGTMFYNSVINSKKEALIAAANYAKSLEVEIVNLREESNKERCQAAILEFKKAIVQANGMGKSSVDLRHTLTKLKVFDEIIPEAQITKRDALERSLYWYDSSEYSQNRWNKGWAITNETLLIAALAGAVTLLALFCPPGLAVLAFAPSFILAMATLGNTINIVGSYNYNQRGVVSDRVAIAPEELHDLLYPPTPVQVQYEPSAPPSSENNTVLAKAYYAEEERVNDSVTSRCW